MKVWRRHHKKPAFYSANSSTAAHNVLIDYKMGDRSPDQSKIRACHHDVSNIYRKEDDYERMRQHYVGLPDFNPTHTLHVKFTSEARSDEPMSESGIECNCGSELSPKVVANAPSHVWWEGPPPLEEGEAYALVELDLDAPSKGKGWMLSPILHYLVVDICEYIDFVPSRDMPWSNVLDKSVLVTNYLKPGPPPGTGPHRYVFILCKQPKLYDIKEVDKLRKTGKFKINWPALVEEYKLQPIGLDFFLTQNPNQYPAF